MKQDQNKPLPVENQVLIIFALTKGYLDDIPVEDITRFEDELNHWAASNATDLLSEIRELVAYQMLINLILQLRNSKSF